MYNLASASAASTEASASIEASAASRDGAGAAAGAVAVVAAVAASDKHKSPNVKGQEYLLLFLLHSHGWLFVSGRNHDVAGH